MDILLSLFCINFLSVFIMMILIWLVSLRMKNAGIIDIFWGLGFVIIAWITFFVAEGYITRKLILTLMTTIWGLRLSIHLFLRNAGQAEDRRYTAMRKKMGDGFWWKSLFTIFCFQAVLLWLISIPVQMGQVSPLPDRITVPDVLGIIIWTMGITMESVSDIQLARFKSDSRNRQKVMNTGLWRYSRHPNYFGESLVWWGTWCVALSVPYGTSAIISPVLITFLLLRVSGVRLLEKNISKRRPDYEDYIRRTSAFFPWFPKGL